MTQTAVDLADVVHVANVEQFDNNVGLTDREVDIVRLVATGLTNDEIATTLFLSVNTVKSYIRSAYGRMRVDSRALAIIWAFDHRLVMPAPLPHDSMESVA